MINHKKLKQSIEHLCQAAKNAAAVLAQLSTNQKNQALLRMAERLSAEGKEIIAINQEEVAAAKEQKLNAAFIDRMTLSTSELQAMVKSLQTVARLPDPVEEVRLTWTMPSGLNISRVSIPLGVVSVIYESRPNVTSDAAALCFKSGNAIILRGGSECAKTNQAIAECLQKTLEELKLPVAAIQYLPTSSRSGVAALLSMNQYIDVIIPRGGKSLMERVQKESRIPILSHLEGLCHTYVHKDASLEMAVKIVHNAKMRCPGICGATETLLIDESIAAEFLPKIINPLVLENCQIRGDARAQEIDSRITAASEEDWSTEYLEAILSVKVVDDLDAAIAHIKTYHSSHTDAIVTNNLDAAQKFLHSIDSAIVMHNCSTQFADGGEFGMGAEIGIATGKLHARGPVGLEQLTTFKYVVRGEGQVRA